MKVKILKRYDDSTNDGLIFTEDSLTHQEFYEDTLTDNILNKFIRVGANPYIPADVGDYIDTTSVGDFQSNMDKFNEVCDFFNSLPSDLRLKFQNNPRVFAQFASNPDNLEQLMDLNLVPRPPKKEEPVAAPDRNFNQNPPTEEKSIESTT